MAKRRWKIEDIKAVVAGENPFIQSGYTKAKVFRKEGEEWTDSKGSWKKQNGNIVSVNKQMDAIRELVKQRCSVCNMDIGLFGDKLDSKVFAKTRKCFACLDIEEQTKKINGTFVEYERQKLFKNKLAKLKEFRDGVVATIKYLKDDKAAKIELVCANGDIVTWSGQQSERLMEEANADLILVNKEIADIEDVVSKMNSQ